MEPAPERSSTTATLHDQVRAARERLVAAGLADQHATFDAEVLARLALGWDRAEYLARRGDAPPAGFDEAYEPLVARRALREPVAQIAGYREFWSRDFEVTRDVLTPRPETELIVEEALAFRACVAGEAAGSVPGDGGRPSPDERPWRVVDVGTGSGCLAVTLALEMPGVDMLATDISDRALAVAQRNADRLGAGNRVRFLCTSLLQGVAPGIDLIVSNPPYVPDRYSSGLSSEVRDYEPAEAVFGGHDGFELIRALLQQSAARLAPGGRLMMEFGAGQDEDVRGIIAEYPHLFVHAIRDDLQGIPRMAIIGRLDDVEQTNAKGQGYADGQPSAVNING
jgi:release factor glutamine methyltransferase